MSYEHHRRRVLTDPLIDQIAMKYATVEAIH